MSLTRETLFEINQRLQTALRTLIEENNLLHEENARLEEENARLSALIARWQRQWRRETARYGRLAHYIETLRAWLAGSAASAPVRDAPTGSAGESAKEGAGENEGGDGA